MMNVTKKLIAGTVLAGATALMVAGGFANAVESKHQMEAGAPLSKERAVEFALNSHPGEVVKAYKETKKDKEVWEVKVKGEDGNKWEMYYDIETGEVVKEEMDD